MQNGQERDLLDRAYSLTLGARIWLSKSGKLQHSSFLSQSCRPGGLTAQPAGLCQPHKKRP
eukprot:1153765-Pelagomonas_calceolata.AAC.1